MHHGRCLCTPLTSTGTQHFLRLQDLAGPRRAGGLLAQSLRCHPSQPSSCCCWCAGLSLQALLKDCSCHRSAARERPAVLAVLATPNRRAQRPSAPACSVRASLCVSANASTAPQPPASSASRGRGLMQHSYPARPPRRTHASQGPHSSFSSSVLSAQSFRCAVLDWHAPERPKHMAPTCRGCAGRSVRWARQRKAPTGRVDFGAAARYKSSTHTQVLATKAERLLGTGSK